MWSEYIKAPTSQGKGEGGAFSQDSSGDKLAREEYIKGNLRLVLSVMKRFDSSNENADEFVSDWMCGACKGRR